MQSITIRSGFSWTLEGAHIVLGTYNYFFFDLSNHNVLIQQQYIVIHNNIYGINNQLCASQVIHHGEHVERVKVV